MIIENLKPSWGAVITTNNNELLNTDPKTIRDLGYEKDLILVKGLKNLTYAEYHKICSFFGSPWESSDYRYSKEFVQEFDDNGVKKAITIFSNKHAPRLGNSAMCWHADIPLFGQRSFPWRALYNTSNPNPESGLTSFLNIRLDLINPTTEELEYYNRIELTMQSWLREGEEICRRSFIKEDPVTHRKSLRANAYTTKEAKDLWIKEVYVDNEVKDNDQILGPIYRQLEQRQDLKYVHKWDVDDLIVYNNWSFIHNRSAVLIGNNEKRQFLRANIDHII